MQQRVKEEHEWSVADTVTSMRIIAAIILGFLSWGTRRFLIVYTFAGLTDVLDGLRERTRRRVSLAPDWPVSLTYCFTVFC